MLRLIWSVSPLHYFVVELFCDLRGCTPCKDETARNARKVTQAAILFIHVCLRGNFVIVVSVILLIIHMKNIIIYIKDMKNIIRIEISRSAFSSASIWPCSPQQACLPRRLKDWEY